MQKKAGIDWSAVWMGSHEELEKRDIEYWSKASVGEKLRTITYLRECFYGRESTTGSIPRTYRMLKREQC